MKWHFAVAMVLTLVSCCAIPCFAEDIPENLPDSAASVVLPAASSIAAASVLPVDSAASAPASVADSAIVLEASSVPASSDSAISSEASSAVDSVASSEIVASVPASPSASVVEPTIWDKPFNDYTPTEGYLFVCAAVLCLGFVVILAKRGVF